MEECQGLSSGVCGVRLSLKESLALAAQPTAATNSPYKAFPFFFSFFLPLLLLSPPFSLFSAKDSVQSLVRTSQEPCHHAVLSLWFPCSHVENRIGMERNQLLKQLVSLALLNLTVSDHRERARRMHTYIE